VKLYRDADATLDHLHGKVVAILGYGNQGRSWALNLRDSGLEVVVGNREDSYLVRARDDGFRALSIEGATREADVLAILTTDESQPTVWEESIVSLLRPGHTLVWASGYNVGYGIIEPPDGVDVVMVAPRTAGSEVRVLFERGVGHLAAAGVHRDCSGKAWRTRYASLLGSGPRVAESMNRRFERKLNSISSQSRSSGPGSTRGSSNASSWLPTPGFPLSSSYLSCTRREKLLTSFG